MSLKEMDYSFLSQTWDHDHFQTSNITLYSIKCNKSLNTQFFCFIYTNVCLFKPRVTILDTV